MSLVLTCAYGKDGSNTNDHYMLLDAIANTVSDHFESKENILHMHMLIHAYVTASVNATFIRARGHYLSISRAVVNTEVKCDGVPRRAKLKFLHKMGVIQSIFALMYKPNEFRVSHAVKTDMYTFLNRANWTQAVSNQRKILLARCFLLANYKPQNYFDNENGGKLLNMLTRKVPYALWSEIYSYV